MSEFTSLPPVTAAEPTLERRPVTRGLRAGIAAAWRCRIARLPLLALAIVALLTGLWGGLLRLPLPLPLLSDNANWITFHGPLMVCGFLGTVIGLERAVGLPNLWAYAAPVLTGAGAAYLVVGGLGRPGPLLFTLGSAAFVAVTLRVVQLRKELFTVTMSLGAMAWLTGNVLWLCDWPFHRVVPWWMAFLGLTIVGERLDLSRFQKPERGAMPLFFVALGLFLLGLAGSAFTQAAGERVLGFGLAALALWLARFDIARRTVKHPGLPRFMALCLLSGYVWLAAAGAMLFCFAPLQSGLRYDAVLHAFFLGFVMAMVFGHAPVIFPSVMGLPMAFRHRFYGHVALLHASLLLRVLGDLLGSTAARQWGGTLNAVTFVLFLVSTVAALISSPRRAEPRVHEAH